MPVANAVSFAPLLYIKNGIYDLDFYIKAFGAIEAYRWTNDDKSIHVAELQIGDAIFHVHEITAKPGYFEPFQHNGTTVLIGLFVPDVDAVMESAIAAGATILSPAVDFDYGFRQGEVQDPHGHTWVIQKKI